MHCTEKVTRDFIFDGKIDNHGGIGIDMCENNTRLWAIQVVPHSTSMTLLAL